MKVLVAILLCLTLCIGCGRPRNSIPPLFAVGQMVDLKIGGPGQIVRLGPLGCGYWVRVDTNEGPKQICLNEFEIKVTR